MPTIPMNQSPEELRRASPPELHPFLPSILDAIAIDMVPTEDWPEGEEYLKARSPRVIGRIVQEQLHRPLDGVVIGYLWSETVELQGQTKLAKVSKVSGKLRHFSRLDFLVEVNHTTWKHLTVSQRIALIDHELCHCALSPTEKPTIVGHDIEEFNAIVRRWGLWKPDVEAFAATIKSHQLGLFDGSTPSAPAPPTDPVDASAIVDGMIDHVGAGGIDLPDGVDSMTISSGKRSITVEKRKRPAEVTK